MKRSPLVVIFITVLVDLLGYGMLVPLLPFYVQRQAGGAEAAGLLGSLYSVMQLFSGPVLGALSDRYGRRPVLLACLLGTVLAYLIVGLADTLAWLFVAIAVDGLTGGNLTTAYAYIADVTAPEARARGMSLVGAAFGLGLMVGPALGGLLSGFGLSVPAFTAAALALGNLLFGWWALPESLPPERRTPTLGRQSLNPAGQLWGLFQLPAVRGLLGAIFTLNLAFAGLQTNFPLFSQARFHWTSTQNGLFFAFVGVCAVLIQGVLFGWLQPRLGERRLAQIGLALMAAGLAGLALAPVDWLLYPVVALVALGTGTSIPSLTALVSGRMSAAEQGRLMGGTQTLLSLAMIGGPTLAGVAFERVAVTAPYWLGAGLSFTALLLAARALRAQPAPVTPTPE
ncbi:MAG: MFS transporter [Anaerolineales bacterium]|nr:MFS transporter [Anaerolineales bacterium]